MPHIRAFLLALFAVLGGLIESRPAVAQEGSTIKIIYPFAAGGAGDTVVRVLADKLQPILKQNIVIDNRTGASGRIGVNAVKNAAPDGATILYTPFAAVTLYPFTFRQLDYDPFTDLEPLSQIVAYDFGIAVGPSVPAKNPQELVAWLKANPSKVQFGSPGAGALPHFFGIQFGKLAGIELTHVAYRGTAPGFPDLLSGQIPMMSSTVTDLNELHSAGKIRIIGTSGTKRSLPDVPTFKESGFDIEGAGWFGTFLPAKTPPDVVARLSKAIMEVVAMPDVQERYKALGYRPTGTTPEELRSIQKADAARWAPVVKASGFVAD
jgi:tripartite-type tricarboxylate transporter receptor subunit TctC